MNKKIDFSKYDFQFLFDEIKDRAKKSGLTVKMTNRNIMFISGPPELSNPIICRDHIEIEDEMNGEVN